MFMHHVMIKSMFLLESLKHNLLPELFGVVHYFIVLYWGGQNVRCCCFFFSVRWFQQRIVVFNKI